MGKNKQTQTTHAQNNPWDPAQPLLNNILGDATRIGDDMSVFTPTYSDATRSGIDRMSQIGGSANPAEAAYSNLAAGTGQGFGVSNSSLIGTARGDYLNSNPYLDSVLSTARQKAADSINRQFSGAGRYGSGSHAGVLADRLGAIETDARMQNYNTERQNQLNASGLLQSAGLRSGEFAGAADNANIQRAQTLLSAGSLRDQMDAAIRQAPMAATQWQAGLGIPIAGLGGTQDSTSVSKTSSNPLGMITGGLMTGLGLLTGSPQALMGGLGSLGGGLMPSGGGNYQMSGSGQPFFGLGSLFGGSNPVAIPYNSR